MISRRQLLKYAGQTTLAANCAPIIATLNQTMLPPGKAVRCINVVNFIREIEPRFQMDMMLPVQKQMGLILEHRLPATWLLQYDGLVSGPFVPFLKEHMAKDHEIGFWFEMNEKHCRAAGVEWRGRPGYEWDHLPPVAFTIGYTPEERVKLADTAMNSFKEIWGKYPKSVANWNLDSLTMSHLVSKYGVAAFAVCRDQIATDGFTIWGAPIAGYYPSKTNCWSPAVQTRNQINVPVFRMLGQDPVYYYNRQTPLPDGRKISEPDTMEPAWTSGRSDRFVKTFLDMIVNAPTGQFGYAQMGQENTFPWPQQEQGYAKQMRALAALRSNGAVHVETMGETGIRFKKAFKATPIQAQVQMQDPLGNTNPEERTVWYQSRFYRANLHFKGDLPYLRDITVYSDDNPQPFLNQATRLNDVEQRMPAILDGYHWRKEDPSPGAGGFFHCDHELLRVTGKPDISERDKALILKLPVTGGRTLTIRFEEKSMSLQLTEGNLELSFEWDTAKASLVSVNKEGAQFREHGFNYALTTKGAINEKTERGWRVWQLADKIELLLAQPR